ncbi:alpha/beta fold hydrolase [Hydrocarboniphaga effusa]|jgi:predicted alpha/beta hydrolase|uniref:alpha/beta hydrolase family protein n=1 Tax=Hydrocarboniphaga effusa TaxID=243629 RepID=UPI00398BC5A1
MSATSAHQSNQAPIRFEAGDGYRLAGTLYPAQGRRPGQAVTAAVVIHPATAVPQRLYQPFAEFLASCGYAVLTYDYRGIGSSAPASLRGFSASMRDWMELDVAAATQVLRERFPGASLLAVGHSVGGHALGISEATHQLRAALIVAAHAGYTGFIEQSVERWRVGAMMRHVGPWCCRLLGYMPGSKLGLGEDLPAGVMRQWARWTRLPNYFFDDPQLGAVQRFAQKRLPLLVLGFDDDPWATRRAISAMMRHYSHCPIEHRQIAPATVGLDAIGHMGFFRRASARKLWPMAEAWLRAQVSERNAA